MESYAPPDPLAAGIAALRAANATPLSTFEDKWKADRLRALAIEHTTLDADAAERVRILAEHRDEILADRSAYKAPDGYAAGIKALRESGR